ncbi:ionic transporter y4hA [Nocardioides flavus (ex Wang et al. 2016)]|uniref:Ionic transporter y4hA n=1 Tax=Nocardioides flavus (ex Wang et al. 2016) TaxID=2058780 RepID=A0ABQ3HMI2_9ACTN|nr:ionic transporter y4hA [Nocardioides flavus (ex Wang et al. 2016)]GHE18746.1 ionic transporter y4hA [Nocardioides flavus (ex Wang et al. 2016)]
MPRPSWTTVTPPLAAVALAVAWPLHPENALVLGLLALVLVGAVLAAVHHAEVVAHRVGEPYGSLVLAVAVTVIEVGLIVTLMVTSDGSNAGLARDTVFAAVMITVNGIVGLSLLVGALKHHLAVFNPEGTGAALATVIALAVLCLVVPSVTTSEPGPEFTGAQLVFAAVASLALYGMFVFTQTIRHRDFFLPVAPQQYVPVVAGPGAPAEHPSAAGESGSFEHEPVDEDEDGHADPPTAKAALTSLALLVVSLVSVVGLAKIESPAIESGVSALGFPYAVVGVVIALLVLAPETIAAVRAAVRNRVQVSLNLALGSAMASIGLTIPAIAVASIWLDGPLELGLNQLQTVLLVLTAAVAILTVVPGRAKTLQGGVHLVLLASFLFLTIAP